MSTKNGNPKDAIGVAKWRQFMVVPRQVLWELGVAMLEGGLKYGKFNYRGAGVRASVYLDAAYGHLDQFTEGEDIDQDSGLSHVTKAIASLVVLRDAMMNDFWTDDRPPKIGDLEATRARLQELVQQNFDRYADKDPHHYTQIEDGAPYRDTAFADLLESDDCECCTDDDWDEEGAAELREMLRNDWDKEIGRNAEDETVSHVLNRVDSTAQDFNDYMASVEGQVNVEFTDPEIFASFASGGVVEPKAGLVGEAGPEAVVPDGTPIQSMDLKAGQHVVLREDTSRYPKGTVFKVEYDSPADEEAHLRSYVEHAPAGTWSRIRFDHVEPEFFKVTEKARRGLVQPREMEVGRWYRVVQLHTGQPADADRAGVWKCRSVDDETAYGTKPGWDEGRRAIPLAVSALFEEVRPIAVAGNMYAIWEPVEESVIDLAMRITGLPREAIVRLEDSDGNVLYSETDE